MKRTRQRPLPAGRKSVPHIVAWASSVGLAGNAVLAHKIPHFMDLACLCHNDYAAGRFKMLSLCDASGQKTSLVALRNCLHLVPLGYLAYDCGFPSRWFWLKSSLLTLAISATGFLFYHDRAMQKARMFLASLLYFPVFRSGLLFHVSPIARTT